MTAVAQCGRTFPHLAHETTKGDCPGLAPDQLNAALVTIAEALGLHSTAEMWVPGRDQTAPKAGGSDDYWAPGPSYADLMAGLTILSEPGCQNFETGFLGLCAHNGLVQRLWCPPCTAYHTMNPTQPQEDPRG